MSFNKLKEFIELAKSEGVSELKYQSDDEKFFVSFNSSPSVISHVPQNLQVDNSTQSSPGAEAGAAENLDEITSPVVGTFYQSSSPGAEPYVKVGDRVRPGQVLCIVEAMKIMNEIESEVSGEIVEICVENENYVEFGQTLFKIKP